MKKFLIISSIIFLSLVILNESHIIDSLVAFLLIGAVPGTTINLSPNAMLAIGVAVLWVVIIDLTVVKLIGFLRTRRMVGRHIARHNRMPKRRYGRI